MEEKLDVLYKDIVELLARQDEKLEEITNLTRDALEKVWEVLDEIDNINNNINRLYE